MGETPDSLGGWAELLERNWSARSHSSRRDSYIAPLPPGAEPGTWDNQARIDAGTMLWGFEAERTVGWQVLEVGCGVGRLVGPLLERVAGYTGFDIAEGMVEEARRRTAGEDRARYFVGDGLTVPAGACDRQYDLVFSHGVLIHCPLEVIRSLLASAWERVAPGGELRFQLLADPTDAEGITSIEAAESDHATAVALDRQQEQEPDPLIEGHYYMGHAFRFAAVEPFLRGLTDGGIQLVRPTLAHVYGIVTRPA